MVDSRWLREKLADASREEHLVQLSPSDTQRVHNWLIQPNGSLSVGGGRVVFEAVANGGMLVRTRGYGVQR